MLKYNGGKLTKAEKDAWEGLQNAIRLDGRGACLIRGKLNGKQRAFIAQVREDGDGYRVYPVAVLLTKKEIEQALGPQGEVTKEV